MATIIQHYCATLQQDINPSICIDPIYLLNRLFLICTRASSPTSHIPRFLKTAVYCVVCPTRATLWVGLLDSNHRCRLLPPQDRQHDEMEPNPSNGGHYDFRKWNYMTTGRCNRGPNGFFIAHWISILPCGSVSVYRSRTWGSCVVVSIKVWSEFEWVIKIFIAVFILQ